MISTTDHNDPNNIQINITPENKEEVLDIISQIKLFYHHDEFKFDEKSGYLTLEYNSRMDSDMAENIKNLFYDLEKYIETPQVINFYEKNVFGFGGKNVNSYSYTEDIYNLIIQQELNSMDDILENISDYCILCKKDFKSIIQKYLIERI